MVDFVLIIGKFLDFEYKIDHNSKNKNQKNLKIDISFVSARCASSIKIRTKLRGGGVGVCISLVGKTEHVLHRLMYIFYFFTSGGCAN